MASGSNTSFKKYLSDTNVVDVLSKVVTELQTEFERGAAPEDPLGFVSSFFSKELEQLMKEQAAESSMKIDSLQKKLDAALAKIARLEEEKAKAEEAERLLREQQAEEDRAREAAVAKAEDQAEAIFEDKEETKEQKSEEVDEGAEIFGEKKD